MRVSDLQLGDPVFIRTVDGAGKIGTWVSQDEDYISFMEHGPSIVCEVHVRIEKILAIGMLSQDQFERIDRSEFAQARADWQRETDALMHEGLVEVVPAGNDSKLKGKDRSFKIN